MSEKLAGTKSHPGAPGANSETAEHGQFGTVQGEAVSVGSFAGLMPGEMDRHGSGREGNPPQDSDVAGGSESGSSVEVTRTDRAAYGDTQPFDD